MAFRRQDWAKPLTRSPEAVIWLRVISAVYEGEEQEDRLETVTVLGRGLELIGEAGAASEGVVGYADFEDRPLSRVGELVEVIPGAVATQHSGEGKANQYFLRGFNLDYGDLPQVFWTRSCLGGDHLERWSS